MQITSFKPTVLKCTLLTLQHKFEHLRVETTRNLNNTYGKTKRLNKNNVNVTKQITNKRGQGQQHIL